MQQMLHEIRRTFGVQDARLTKKQIAILKYISEHTDEACYYSLRQLCESIGCSQVTMLRLCRELGYDSFVAFREAIRSNRSAAYHTEHPAEQDPSAQLFDTVLRNERLLFEQFLSQIDPEAIDRCAKQITEADFVLIIARRMSNAIGRLFSARLGQCSIENEVVDPVVDAKRLRQLIGRLTRDSVVFSISYPIYSEELMEVLPLAKATGAHLISITDAPEAPVAALSDQLLICPRSLDNVYNSFITSVELTNLLAHSIVIRMGITYESLVGKTEE